MEIIYLGISQLMHRHYENMGDLEYAKNVIYAVTRVLETALGCEEGKIIVFKQ